MIPWLQKDLKNNCVVVVLEFTHTFALQLFSYLMYQTHLKFIKLVKFFCINLKIHRPFFMSAKVLISKEEMSK